MSPESPNRRLVEVVARRLGPIREDVALVGGTSVEFLLTDPAAPEARPTLDVDLIVEARSYAEYVSRFGDRLRERGFLECSDRDAPMCRWVVEGVRVDFMPTDEEALGFTNRWYPAALAASDRHAVTEGLDLRVVTAPYFLATKAEAFKGRGKGDFLGSSDLEDFVTVVDGRCCRPPPTSRPTSPPSCPTSRPSSTTPASRSASQIAPRRPRSAAASSPTTRSTATAGSPY